MGSKPLKMTSLLRAISERLTPNVSSTDLPVLKKRDDGFSTAKNHASLFPLTNPDVDGDECLHDCETCTIRYPNKFSIDEDDTVYGNIGGWSRHLLVATGKTDWVRDVSDEKGSVMEAVGKHNSKVEGGNLMLSASNIPVPEHAGSEGPYGKDRPTSVLLLPVFKWVDGVTPTHVPELIQSVINTAPTNTTPLKTESGTEAPAAAAEIPTVPEGLTLRNCPHKYLILLCSQATRDARCGQSAPLLRRELERHLRPLGLYRDLGDERPGGVGIYFISHVGGHKYSANMLIYRRGEPGRTVKEQMSEGAGNGGKKEVAGEAAQCIWLARVRPDDCENIVRFTVMQGKVVKPERQLRGGFDRENAVVSW